MSVEDPAQSDLVENCSLIAAMASCAWLKKGNWFKYVTVDDPLRESYQFTFYDYQKSIPQFSTSPAIQLSNGIPLYARSTTIGESWPGIVEKAYYISRDYLRGLWDDPANLDSAYQPDIVYYNPEERNPTANPKTVLFHLLGVEPKYYDSLPADVFLELEKICTGVIPYKKIKFPAVAWTKTDAPAPITNKHTYSILGLAGTKTPGGAWLTKYIVLRDPKNVAADPGFGANEVLASKWLMFDFTQKDGIFALKADLFPTYFQGYAYVPV